MAIQRQISEIEFPKFVVIKNLQTKSLDYDSIENFIEGEIICITDSLGKAKEEIPHQKFPADPVKQQLYIDIFEEGDDLKAGDNVGFPGSDYLWSIIEPEDCPYSSGKDVFGVTYTIIWVCPPDKSKILESLISQIQNRCINNSSCPGNEIEYMWDEVLGRMIFNQSIPDDSKCNRLDIISDFEEYLKNLPNSPTQNDWDYLDEIWTK